MEKALRKNYPIKVKTGYALIGIGSALSLVVSILGLAVLGLVPFFGEINWANLNFVRDYIISMVGIVLEIAAAIAGFNYIAHRKFLVWLVAFAAIFFFGISIHHGVDLGIKIANGTWQSYDITQFVSTFVTQTIYFIGWWISKDYFDD